MEIIYIHAHRPPYRNSARRNIRLVLAYYIPRVCVCQCVETHLDYAPNRVGLESSLKISAKYLHSTLLPDCACNYQNPLMADLRFNIILLFYFSFFYFSFIQVTYLDLYKKCSRFSKLHYTPGQRSICCSLLFSFCSYLLKYKDDHKVYNLRW